MNWSWRRSRRHSRILTFGKSILLPVSALADLTPQMMEAILAHELAHIRRHDYLLNILQTAIETLLFYHPAVWWVGKKIRQERENCCDDLAVTACGDAMICARSFCPSSFSFRLPSQEMTITFTLAPDGISGKTNHVLSDFQKPSVWNASISPNRP
jgi:BlaR1 peptidase M56